MMSCQDFLGWFDRCLFLIPVGYGWLLDRRIISLLHISCPPSIFYMWLVFLGALAFYFHGAPKKCVSANKRFIGKDVGTV